MSPSPPRKKQRYQQQQQPQTNRSSRFQQAQNPKNLPNKRSSVDWDASARLYRSKYGKWPYQRHVHRIYEPPDDSLYLQNPHGWYNKKLATAAAADGVELVKRCLGCEHFSNDHENCSNCGAELRKNARLFRDPFHVHSVFTSLLDIVENYGPDFKLVEKSTETETNKSGESSRNKKDSEEVSCLTAPVPVARNQSVPTIAPLDDRRRADEQEYEELDNVITISSDSEEDEDENTGESSSEESIIEEDDDDDDDDDDMQETMHLESGEPVSKASASENYIEQQNPRARQEAGPVKSCRACGIYSFDLGKCQLCGNPFSKNKTIKMFQDLSERARERHFTQLRLGPGDIRRLLKLRKRGEIERNKRKKKRKAALKKTKVNELLVLNPNYGKGRNRNNSASAVTESPGPSGSNSSSSSRTRTVVNIPNNSPHSTEIKITTRLRSSSSKRKASSNSQQEIIDIEHDKVHPIPPKKYYWFDDRTTTTKIQVNNYYSDPKSNK